MSTIMSQVTCSLCYRDDIQMDSPYNRNKYRKKNNKSNSSITHTTSETPKKIKILKIIKRTI